MGDDGIGVHSVRRLAAEAGRWAGVRCIDGGTLGYLLSGYLEGVDGLIVIDAARMQAAPGTVALYLDEAMDDFLSTRPNRSVHEVGLADLMSMALLSGQLPERRALIAVEPRETDWNTELSKPIAASLDRVCQSAAMLIETWRA